MPDLFSFPAPPTGHEVSVSVNVEELARALLVEATRSEDFLFRIIIQLTSDSARMTEVMAQHCPPLADVKAVYEKRLEDHRRAAAPGLLDMLLGRGPSASEIEELAHRQAVEEAMDMAHGMSFLHNGEIQAMLADRRQLVNVLANTLMERANAGHARSRRIIQDLLDRTLGRPAGRRR
jgi:hypothetical protein